MNSGNTILDFEQKINDPELFLASTGMWFTNYFVDSIIQNIFFYSLLFAFDSTAIYSEDLSGFVVILALLSIPFYFILFEYFLGKTPAKYITKTKVVTAQGRRPKFWQVVGRTFARYIPFEAFSFFGNRPVGWHDSLSKTRVVTDGYGNVEEDFVWAYFLGMMKE